MRIAFTTLGCKINQVETDSLRRDFESRGDTIVPFNAEADVYIINTCSVTAKSDYQCRQAIRSAVRRSHSAKIIVTGCYAELRPEEIKKIPGVDLIVGSRDKLTIPSVISPLPSSQVPNSTLQKSAKRTRGFLKIQDGCDNRCSYCVVPLARGGSRSISQDEVVREFRALVQAGYPEIVLTGIHIGAYGTDLPTKTHFTDLLKVLVRERGESRIRLSSIEPREVTPELSDLLGNALCKHLHIPLQSGDDKILSEMKRDYTSAFYLNLLRQIADRVPAVALGADIMVGFPGEGEEEFQNTLRLVEQSPLTHLHVFSYSQRPGTPAATMKDQVPETVKKSRNEILRALASEKNYQFRKIFEGQTLEVVLESKQDKESGMLSGLTDNYIRIHVEGAKNEHIGKKNLVRIKSVKDQRNIGEIL